MRSSTGALASVPRMTISAKGAVAVVLMATVGVPGPGVGSGMLVPGPGVGMASSCPTLMVLML